MKEKMLLTKICSMYASDLHFATVIFPFIAKQVEKNTIVRTIFEKDEKENIEKVIENIGLNSEIKEKIRQIDWTKSDIIKIRNIFKQLEEDIKLGRDTVVIVLGNNIFINKINKAIELWLNNNIEKVKEKESEINIINCFSIEENKEVDKIFNSHDYVLKTSGLEDIIKEEKMLKAN